MRQQAKVAATRGVDRRRSSRLRRYAPLDGNWTDPKWVIGSSRPGLRDSDVVLDWNLLVRENSKLTPAARTRLIETCKEYIASLMIDPPPGTQPLSFLTVRNEYFRLRVLVSWMVTNEFSKFSQLDSATIEEFLNQYANREAGRCRTIKAVGQLALAIYRLYLQRYKLKDSIKEHPFRGRRPREAAARIGKKQLGTWKALSDDVAVSLIGGALEMIAKPADDLLEHRNTYGRALEAARAGGKTRTQARKAAIAAVKEFKFSVLPGETEPWFSESPVSIAELAKLNRHLMSACAVVILYLCGTRVSEMLQLGPKSLTWIKHSDGRSYPYIEGTLAKSGGRNHRWVVSDDVKRAIDVMERLSAPFREKTGIDNYWVRISGNGLWPTSLTRRTACIYSTQSLNTRLGAFGKYLGIKKVRLHSHRGRKTFTRFIVRRDTLGLHALSQHLGHLHWLITDRNYAGTDFELSEMVREEDQEDLRRSLEDLISSPKRKGKGLGNLGLASEQFRFPGRIAVRKQVDEYIASGVNLAPCHWGYCVYRQDTSSCRGSSVAPNPSNRTPGTCARCQNFCVTEKHVPWWEERKRVTEEALGRRGVHEQARAVLKQRLYECDFVLLGSSKPKTREK